MSSSAPTIVVGVDGSKASRDALAWAATQADQTGARLEVIRCWRQPVTYGYAPDYGEDADFAKDAREELDELLDQVLGPEPKILLEARVTEGHAAPILVEASRSADLLVVGSRGHGAFAGMLLGSTSHYCANHASCPVVVVRAVDEAATHET
jgi:nucleotide-binding universal stress UspA family protein